MSLQFSSQKHEFTFETPNGNGEMALLDTNKNVSDE